MHLVLCNRKDANINVCPTARCGVQLRFCISDVFPGKSVCLPFTLLWHVQSGNSGILRWLTGLYPPRIQNSYLCYCLQPLTFNPLKHLRLLERNHLRHWHCLLITKMKERRIRTIRVNKCIKFICKNWPMVSLELAPKLGVCRQLSLIPSVNTRCALSLLSAFISQLFSLQNGSHYSQARHSSVFVPQMDTKCISGPAFSSPGVVRSSPHRLHAVTTSVCSNGPGSRLV